MDNLYLRYDVELTPKGMHFSQQQMEPFCTYREVHFLNVLIKSFLAMISNFLKKWRSNNDVYAFVISIIYTEIDRRADILNSFGAVVTSYDIAS